MRKLEKGVLKLRELREQWEREDAEEQAKMNRGAASGGEES